MMYTEEEMRRKWCHRTTREYIEYANGDAPTLHEKCRCIASQCGAWRIGHTDMSAGLEWAQQEPMHKTVEEHEAVHGPRPKPIVRGYCGLAGRTE